MSPKRRKPMSPEQMAANRLNTRIQAFGAVGLPAEAAVLQAYDDVEITRIGEQRASQRAGEDSARRLDAFDALRPSMVRQEFAGAYDAARRLERDILISLGQHDHGRTPDRVDCEQAAYSRVDAIIDASRRVQRVRDRLADRDWWMLSELITPTRQGEAWRICVGRITGEANWNAQGAAVRSACVNLRDAYQALDVGARQVA